MFWNASSPHDHKHFLEEGEEVLTSFSQRLREEPTKQRTGRKLIFWYRNIQTKEAGLLVLMSLKYQVILGHVKGIALF